MATTARQPPGLAGSSSGAQGGPSGRRVQRRCARAPLVTDAPRVLLAGGGTAGHTSPLLATADALRRLDPTVVVTALGTPRGIETRVRNEWVIPARIRPRTDPAPSST